MHHTGWFIILLGMVIATLYTVLDVHVVSLFLANI